MSGQAELQSRADFEQARAQWLTSKLPLIYIGNFTGAVGLVVGLWWTAQPPALLTWLAVQVAHLVVCRAWTWRRLQPPVTELAQAQFWGRYVLLSSAGQAIIWGAAAVLFLPAEPSFALALPLFAMASVIAGGGPMLSSHPGAYALFAVVTAVPVVAILASGPMPLPVYAALFVAFVATNLLLSVGSYQTVAKALHEQIAKQRLSAALAEQLDIAHDAQRTKSRFLAAVSHDLRQPLTAVELFASRLLGPHGTAETPVLLDGLRRSTESLSLLINALLAIARLDAGGLRAEPRTVATRALLDDVLADQASQGAGKGLTLRARGRDHRILADPVLLRRVLGNLLANAVRYTKRGRVVIGARRRAGLVRIAVWDTGPGITADAQDIVFEEFQQLEADVEDAASATPAGLGLGLSIAQRLAGLMGTRVVLRSEPGRGSCFWLDLPVAAESSVEQAELARAADAGGAVVGTQRAHQAGHM